MGELASTGRDDLSLLFSRIWTELTPDRAFDEHLTWAESGVDSLTSLIFWLRLEEVLGRPLSYDLMTREMTLGDLIDVLAAPRNLEPSPPTAPDLFLDAPIFLVPALFGDEPILADFRHSLVGRLAFDTLALPDIDHPAAALSDMGWTADRLVSHIVERRPDGPLCLAGYSLGCVMAFEAANRLTAQGRDVRQVCLIDPPFNIGPRAGEVAEQAKLAPPLRSLRTSLRLVAKEEGPVLYAIRVAFGALMRFAALELARRLVLATAPLHDARVHTLRRMRLIAEMRGRALRRWRPAPCPAPVLLIISDEMNAQDSLRSWGALCPDLTVQRVSGAHRQIFEPEGLEKLNPALLAALTARQGATLRAVGANGAEL